MTKEEIIEVLKQKTIQSAEKFSPEQFDLNKDLKELGIDSLTMVEIVAATSRHLKIKVQRPKYAKVKNLSQLVDLFYEHQ